MRFRLLALAMVAVLDVEPAKALVNAAAPHVEQASPFGLARPNGRTAAPDARNGLLLDRRLSFDPLVIGGLAGMVLIVLADTIRRWQVPARRVPVIDTEFEARAFVVTSERDRPLDPLRHFHPEAPALRAAAIERSRPDYIRVDDTVEVWTPLRVHAARDPASTAGRRRTDAAGAGYRFHRIDRDGMVRAAALRSFATDADARDFAEASGCGEAIEVWCGDRRVATVPATLVG